MPKWNEKGGICIITDLSKFIESNFEGCKYCISSITEYSTTRNEKPNSSLYSYVWEILKDNQHSPEDWINYVPLECPTCNHELNLSDFLIVDLNQYEEEIITQTVESCEKYIAQCEYCNSEKIPYEQRYGDPTNLNQIYDIFSMEEVPEEIQNKVLSKLKCCGCGNGFTDLNDAIVTESELEKWHSDEEIDYISNLIVKTFAIPKEAQENFAEYLIQYPMLGLDHYIGKQIYQRIKDNNIPSIKGFGQGQILFRARKRDKIARHVPFVDSELWAAPLGVSSHGRYNPIGVPVLYLGDSMKTCLSEIDLCSEEIAEVGKFVILKDITIWDVRETDINDFVSMPSFNRRLISKEYVFPNFLAQCCSSAGIDGILYGSVKNNQGWNIALFHYKKDESILLTHIQTLSKKATNFVG